MSNIAAIILAAGKGTRMKSELHKVLHPIAARPMLMHLMASVDALEPAKKVVVVGDKADQLRDALGDSAETVVQEPQLGTGHAVQQAESTLKDFDGDVLILYGDVPRAQDLFALLARVTNNNAAGEYYLVDIVNIAVQDGRHCHVVKTDPYDVTGINSRGELAAMEAEWQKRRRVQAMADGASLIAPETVWFSYDTQLGRDVTIEPNVFFGPGVRVADNVKIRANSHIEGAVIGEGCEVGPFARLRPGTVLEEKAKIGNFVETKKAHLGKGAKANHLTYLGDAEIGAKANIGAGTITCNYDGYFKYQTVIGEGAFIGSNSALIAPVKIGRDAIVAAGSAVSRDVADGELRMVRAEQLVKPGWADRFHDTMRKKKQGK